MSSMKWFINVPATRPAGVKGLWSVLRISGWLCTIKVRTVSESWITLGFPVKWLTRLSTTRWWTAVSRGTQVAEDFHSTWCCRARACIRSGRELCGNGYQWYILSVWVLVVHYQYSMDHESIEYWSSPWRTRGCTLGCSCGPRMLHSSLQKLHVPPGFSGSSWWWSSKFHAGLGCFIPGYRSSMAPPGCPHINSEKCCQLLESNLGGRQVS